MDTFESQCQSFLEKRYNFQTSASLFQAAYPTSINDEVKVTPSDLQLQAQLYKKYFSQLKKCFIQVETKRRFLQASAKDDMEFISSNQMNAAELRLGEIRKSLKHEKDEVQFTKSKLLDSIDDIFKDHNYILQQINETKELSNEIGKLSEELKLLQEYDLSGQENEIEEAEKLVLSQKEDLDSLQQECESLNEKRGTLEIALSEKTSNLQELKEKATEKNRAVSQLEEELKSQDPNIKRAYIWHKNALQLLSDLVGIRHCEFVSPTILHLQYHIQQKMIDLQVTFVPGSKNIQNAKAMNHHFSFEDIVEEERETNRGLYEFVHQILRRCHVHIERQKMLETLDQSYPVKWSHQSDIAEVNVHGDGGCFTFEFVLGKEFPISTSSFHLENVHYQVKGDNKREPMSKQIVQSFKENIKEKRPQTILEAILTCIS